jgi:site-specific DNA recombinase
LSLKNCSTRHKVENKRVAIRTRTSNGDHVTCCRVRSGVVPVVLESTNGKDKSERIRIRCSAATESGTCRDAKTFYLHTVESAVLAGLEAEMRHPSVIAEYVRTYLEERKRLSAKGNAKPAHLETRLGELNREIDRLVDAIAKGRGDPAVLGPRSTVLNEERKQIAVELKVEPAPKEIVALHPAILARYERQLAALQDALSKGINAGDSHAAEAIRDLVETVTVFRPGAPRRSSCRNSWAAERPARRKCQSQQGSRTWGKVVAGERYTAIPTTEEALFSYRRRAA